MSASIRLKFVNMFFFYKMKTKNIFWQQKSPEAKAGRCRSASLGLRDIKMQCIHMIDLPTFGVF